MSLLGNPLVSSSFPVDNFTGDGTTVSYVLSKQVGSPNAVEVFFNGVHQNPTTYTISGTTITFFVAPPNNVEIVCRALGVAGTVGVVAAGSVIPNMLSAGRPTWDASGNLTVTGQITGNLTGNVTGNASSATKLQTARTINGTAFDGTANINVNVTEAQVTDGILLARVADNETVSGAWQFNNPIVTATPVSGSHAATKDYVDQAVAGLSWKNSVLVATTANIALTGLQTIDGVALSTGQRVLVKNQSTASQNGVYVTSNGAWTRATDFDQISPLDEINSAAVFVRAGTTQADTSWTQTAAVVTVGTDAIVFAQFAGANTFAAGAGMTLTGNTFDVGTASASRIVVNTDNIDLATVTDSGSGTFKKVTVDAYGRTTGTSAVVASDITALVDSTYVKKAGDTMSGDLTFGATTNTIFTNNIGSISSSAPTTFLNNADWIWKKTAGGGNNEWMRLTSTGNLGVGTTSFGYATTGRTIVAMNGSTSGMLELQSNAVTRGYVLGNSTGIELGVNAGYFNIIAGGSERMRVDASGNVGIGLTPITRLSVFGTISQPFAFDLISIYDGTSVTRKPILTTNYDSGSNSDYLSIVAPASSVSGVGADIRFSTGTFAGSTERMRIDTNGAVRVLGTTAEIYFGATSGSGNGAISVNSTGMRFYTNGTEAARISSLGAMLVGSTALWSSYSSALNVRYSGAGTQYGLALGSADNTTTTTNAITFLANASASAGTANVVGSIKQNNTSITLAASSTLTFETGASERMRIDSTGKVGFGIVPTRPVHIKGDSGYGMLRLEGANAGNEASMSFKDSSDADITTWVIGKNLAGGALAGGVGAFGWYYNNQMKMAISTAGVIQDGAGNELGFKAIKPNTNSWVMGQCNVITAALQIDQSVAGNVYSIYNNTSGSLALTQGGGLTLRLGGTTVTGNRTLLPRGFATIWFLSATECIINGNVT